MELGSPREDVDELGRDGGGWTATCLRPEEENEILVAGTNFFGSSDFQLFWALVYKK
jgi:hypothetical protein